jgi:nicotinamide-nucleotide amidase
MPGTAAIVTVGSEILEGLRLDTNTADIARMLAPRGWHVMETVSIGDDVVAIAAALGRLTASHGLVVVTGGLGPTHDDVTRQGASEALDVALKPDARILAMLEPWAGRHSREAAAAVLDQALILEGAEVIDPTTGTAPGQVLYTGDSTLALLPGPPAEMLPMLETLVSRWDYVRAETVELGVVGMPEAECQLKASAALEPYDGIGFTILSGPGDVRLLLLDDGAGHAALPAARDAVAAAMGDACYTTTGATLGATVVLAAIEAGVTLGAAESCTGGMVGAALTTEPGSSAAFLGGVVSYHDDVKHALLGVSQESLDEYGAVSEQVAREMAEGVLERLGADIAVSVTGIAGPTGGTAEKPVGLVWFAVATSKGTRAVEKRFSGASRDAVRARATATALDLLRVEIRAR